MKDCIDNDTEFDYKLSSHAALMLLQGMISYREDTIRMFWEEHELASYCSLRIGTTVLEAKKLLEWQKNHPRPCIVPQIEDFLLKLENDSKLFHQIDEACRVIAIEELTKE
jgi:hypothetical protein